LLLPFLFHMPNKKRSHSEISRDNSEADAGKPTILIRGIPEGNEDKVKALIESHAKIQNFVAIQEHQRDGEKLPGKKQITVVLSSDEASGNDAVRALKSLSQKKALGAPDLNAFLKRDQQDRTPTPILVVRVDSIVKKEQAEKAFPTAASVEIKPSFEWFLVRAKFASVDQAEDARKSFSGSFGDIKAVTLSFQQDGSGKKHHKRQKTEKKDAPVTKEEAPVTKKEAPKKKQSPPKTSTDKKKASKKN